MMKLHRFGMTGKLVSIFSAMGLCLCLEAQDKPATPPGAVGQTGQSPTNAPPLWPTNRPPRHIEFPKPIPAPKPIESSLNSLTNLPLRIVGPGMFELGVVRMDKTRRTLTFPALLNRDQGPMEYFLVTSYGKTHESILKTEAEPYHIHIAMLLLGATGAGTDQVPGAPNKGVPGPIINPSKETMPGDKITMEVSWLKDGKETLHSAEELVFNSQTQSSPQAGSWVYNGSLIINGKFLAQLDGSLVSLVTDPVALINNTAAGHDNDRIWSVNTNSLPPLNLPVQVSIKLEAAPAK